MAAKTDKQLRVLVEDLNAILHSVRDPDMSVSVDRDSLGPREISRAIARFAEGTDKLPSASKISTRLFRVSQT